MSKTDKIGFKLSKIETEQFALIEENFLNEEDVDINTKLSYGINIKDRIFIVTNRFTYENNDSPFLIIQASCFFSIIKDTWESFIKDNEIVFPKGFVAHMTMLTVGTTRGILHSETSGTDLNKYFLPTINVAEMISEDVKFDI